MADQNRSAKEKDAASVDRWLSEYLLLKLNTGVMTTLNRVVLKIKKTQDKTVIGKL